MERARRLPRHPSSRVERGLAHSRSIVLISSRWKADPLNSVSPMNPAFRILRRGKLLPTMALAAMGLVAGVVLIVNRRSHPPIPPTPTGAVQVRSLPDPTTPRVWVISIGIEMYKDEAIPPCHGAARDARDVGMWFVRTAGWDAAQHLDDGRDGPAKPRRGRRPARRPAADPCQPRLGVPAVAGPQAQAGRHRRRLLRGSGRGGAAPGRRAAGEPRAVVSSAHRRASPSGWRRRDGCSTRRSTRSRRRAATRSSAGSTRR